MFNRYFSVTFTTALWAVSAAGYADPCSCTLQNHEKATVYQLESETGDQLLLKLRGEFPKVGTTSGFICSTDAQEISSVVLWMPAHGHGSVPTILSPEAPDCTAVSRIYFSMAGAWQLRVESQNGGKWNFDVDVAR